MLRRVHVRRSYVFFFFSSRRRHTRCGRDWSSDVCSSDLRIPRGPKAARRGQRTRTAWRPPEKGPPSLNLEPPREITVIWASQARRDSPRRPADEPEGAYREAPKPLHLRRHREEPESLIRQVPQATQMLDDRDSRAQQDRMGGARAVRVVVNVERIDPDERGVAFREELGRGASQG